MSEKSIVTLPRLDLFTPVALKSIDNEFSYQTEQHDDFINNHYNYFPAILNADGSIWTHATLYLLSKIESVKPNNHLTLSSIASDLISFGRFIDIEDIDYLSSPKRKLRRPTYAYRSYLQDRVISQNLGLSTANRRIKSIVSFYRWLGTRKDTKFDFPLFQAKEVSISYRDVKGFTQSKRVNSSNLSFNVPKNRDDYSEYIKDGGKLRPLSLDEQKSIFKALGRINNTEMTLAFLIALATGARMQTVFTLRLKDFLTPVVDGKQLILKVGLGTGVDTKYDKQMLLYLPSWVQYRIKTYIASQRANKRRKICSHEFSNSEDQYLFLTQSGSPFYLGKYDGLDEQYRTPPKGGSIRQFISEKLIPELKKDGKNFDFSFHYLRASFGMNLLDSKLRLIDRESTSLLDVLMFVKERMGHNRIETTEQYLNYRKKIKIASFCQENYEKYLTDLMLFQEPK
ncbi:MAG: site-specific integrase [Oleispira antarctica]|nr:site-specific integrase [Oleispira antarctica]MBQ0792634.1 site-specific integrase [Oleispira antarctica]